MPATQTPHRPALEVAVTSASGARAALAGGADRVELCVALELGGLTPSQGLVEAAVEVGLPVQALIRCRPGDFVFDADEIDTMEREVRAVVDSGAAGVVIGALTVEGALDLGVITRLAAAARFERDDAEITVHRAIDQSRDPVAAVASLIGLGADRVLTSGGAARAGLGLDTLGAMARVSGGPAVMAGGGVRVADVPALLAVGVDAVHVSAKAPAPRAEGAWIALGDGVTEAGDTHSVTDPAIVEAIRAQLSSV